MSSHPYLTLVILYTFTFYFSMHQASHLAYLDAERRVKLNPYLALLMSVELTQLVGAALFWLAFSRVDERHDVIHRP
jgi:hypothetical protein